MRGKWIFCCEGKNFMGNEHVQAADLYILIVVGLLFRFGQLFGHVAFSFAGRLGDVSVFAEIFYDIIIVDRIIDQWQNRT